MRKRFVRPGGRATRDCHRLRLLVLLIGLAPAIGHALPASTSATALFTAAVSGAANAATTASVPASVPLSASVAAQIAPPTNASAGIDICAGRNTASCSAPGHVDGPRLGSVKNRLGTADSERLARQAHAALQVFTSVPVLAKPVGMAVQQWFLFEFLPEGADAQTHPQVLSTSILVRPLDISKANTLDRASGTWKGSGEGPALTVRFNDPAYFLSITPINVADPTLQFSEPQQVGNVQGYPVYQTGHGEVLLISKDGRLPWRYVPVGRYLENQRRDEQVTWEKFAALNSDDADLARHQNARKMLIANIDAALAAMSEAEKMQPVCVSERRRKAEDLSIDQRCGAKTHRLVELDRDLYNGASRTDLRIAAVSSTWGVLPKNDRMPNALGRVLRQVIHDADLKTIEALLR